MWWAERTVGVVNGRFALPVVVVGALLLTGCSADSLSRGQLAEAAGDAASAARSAGLVLGLAQNDRPLPTVSDTGLDDAGKALAGQAATVSALTANGGIGEDRDRILVEIRAAQDAVLSAQDALAAGRDRLGEIDAARTNLDRLAHRLDAASKRLEKQG